MTLPAPEAMNRGSMEASIYKRTMTLDITNHAAERYRERIRDVPPENVRAEMEMCFAAAKEKHRQRFGRQKRKRTAMVPTGCCIFVFERGTMVTVLPRDRLYTLGQSGR